MCDERILDLPLLALEAVLLPGEKAAIRVLEPHERELANRCVRSGCDLGIVFQMGEASRDIGCTATVVEARSAEGDAALDVLLVGQERFRVLRWRAERHLVPIEVEVEVVPDRDDQPTEASATRARKRYGDLVEGATGTRPDADTLASLDSYSMAAAVDLGLDAKQSLLELRSEEARLKLLARLLEAGLKRQEFSLRAQKQAQSNGKMTFGQR